MRLHEFNYIDKGVELYNKFFKDEPPPQGSKVKDPVPNTAVAPIHDLLLVQDFKGSEHQGVDLRAQEGTPIFAPEAGIVSTGYQANGAGHFINLKSATGLHKMMHLSKIQVISNQRVKQGQQIGLTGNTGHSTGPHLHWEYWVDGKAVNPLSILK